MFKNILIIFLAVVVIILFMGLHKRYVSELLDLWFRNKLKRKTTQELLTNEDYDDEPVDESEGVKRKFTFVVSNSSLPDVNGEVEYGGQIYHITSDMASGSYQVTLPEISLLGNTVFPETTMVVKFKDIDPCYFSTQYRSCMNTFDDSSEYTYSRMTIDRLMKLITGKLQSLLEYTNPFDRKYEIIADGDKEGFSIRALRDISYRVKKGQMGGKVDSEKNLSQFGECWIDMGCSSRGGALVTDNAVISGAIDVSGRAIISDNSYVDGCGRIGDSVIIGGKAKLSGDLHLHGNIFIADAVNLSGRITINGNPIIRGNISLRGTVEIGDNVKMVGDYDLYGEFVLKGQEELTAPPFYFHAGYPVTITQKYLCINTTHKPFEEWLNLTEDEVSDMPVEVYNFWKNWGPSIIKMREEGSSDHNREFVKRLAFKDDRDERFSL